MYSVSLALIPLLLVAACGADTGPNDGVSTTGAEAVRPVEEPGVDPVASPAFPSLAGETAYLTDVRVAGHEGFDRVVLEFRGTDVPSYRVRYVDPPIRRDGSGEVVPDRVIPPRGEVVTEAVGAGDVEKTLAWTVGLDHRAPFAVAVLGDPLRLVVDVERERVPPSA